MKIFAILTTMIIATTAFAGNSGSTQGGDSSPSMVTLDSVAINGQQTPYVGQLTVDNANNKMILKIYEDHCGTLKPTGDKVRCMALAHLVIELSVPVTERSFPCGSTQIYGLEDLSTVDGLRTEIVFVDHRTRLCKDIVPYLFAVEASTFNPWDGTSTQYSLTGEK